MMQVGAAPVPRRWRDVTREAAGDRVNQVVFAVVAVAAGFGYSILLPYDYTLRLSPANWRFFGPRYAAFTVAFALGLAWVVTLQVHAMRRAARAAAARPRRAGRAGILAAVVSLLPSFACCSPIVPTLVGLAGLPVAAQLRTTGTITYFFATKQNWLLGGALALLVISGLWSVHKLARAQCLADGCCAGQEDAVGQPEPAREGPVPAPGQESQAAAPARILAADGDSGGGAR
jgi:hypothetical protein